MKKWMTCWPKFVTKQGLSGMTSLTMTVCLLLTLVECMSHRKQELTHTLTVTHSVDNQSVDNLTLERTPLRLQQMPPGV